MIVIFLLVASMVFDETVPIEYEDFNDESYSYNSDDDDEDLDSTPFPSTEKARVRRFPEATMRMEPEKSIKEALKKIMSGRSINDWNFEASPSEIIVDEQTATYAGYKMDAGLNTYSGFSTFIGHGMYTDELPAHNHGSPVRIDDVGIITTEENKPVHPTMFIITHTTDVYDYNGQGDNSTLADDFYGAWIKVLPSRTPKNLNTNDDKNELQKYKNMTGMESEITTETTEFNQYDGLTVTEDNITLAEDNSDDWLEIIPSRSTSRNKYTNEDQRDSILRKLDQKAGLEGNKSESENERRSGNVGRDGNDDSKSTTENTNTSDDNSTDSKGNNTSPPFCIPTNATTTTEAETTTKERAFDVEKFLEIVANLTYDYYTNLTDQVNETLIKMGVPTCGTPTTTEQPTTTTEVGPIDYSIMAKYLKGKCFVCGLEDPGIPYDANCADAFAGDFIPLVPQDPRAKGKIARYRKYCRYKNVDNYQLNSTMPRSIFGRWTGGCAVRWTDISTVYTQRTCRNRFEATTGQHFASKRMAKLEMTLASMDNGCIISPVATLLPLSRGISLYARFHACVCTGSWCNTAQLDSDISMTSVIVLTVVTWLNMRYENCAVL